MATTDKKELQRVLYTAYQEQFVAKRSTHLVVEGFPRSANTYCVECIKRSALLGNNSINIAHHTHDIRNVELAQHFGLPVLILIRDPIFAIASYSLYMNFSFDKSARIYTAFYSRLLDLKPHCLVAGFSTVVGNINELINVLGQYVPVTLSVFNEPDRVRASVLSQMKERAVSRHGEQAYLYKSGVPDEDRRRLSEIVREKVKEHLEEKPEAKHIYEQVLESSLNTV